MVGLDTITDFSGAKGDRIDLSAIDADTTTAGNQAFTFVGAGNLTAAGQLQARAYGADMRVTADVNGDGRADLQIQIVGGAVLLAGDFIL